MIQAHTWQR